MLRLLGTRILRTIAGNRAVDDTRVDLVDRIVVDAELLGYARTEALDDYVCFLGHLLEPFNNFFVLEVQGNRLLVAAQCGDVIGDAAALSGVIMAHEVAKTGIFNLDYRCAEIGKDLRCIATGQVAREVKNGQSRKRCVCACHISIPLSPS